MTKNDSLIPEFLHEHGLALPLEPSITISAPEKMRISPIRQLPDSLGKFWIQVW